jgi:hypothetical protein
MNNVRSLRSFRVIKEIENHTDNVISDATDIISIIYFWNCYNSLLSKYDLTIFEYENELLDKINSNWR